MPAFSTRLACTLCLLIGGCWDVTYPFIEVRPLPWRPPIHIPEPVDPGDKGSRNLLQHYLATQATRREADAKHRKRGNPRTFIPYGAGIEREMWGWDIYEERWRLPFKSERIVATLVTAAARDRLDDLPLLLHPDAKWGRPDPRMVSARPIFGDRTGAEFLAAFQAAVARLPAKASYNNPSSVGGAEARYLGKGAEPMWSYFESGNDRVLFRLKHRDGRPWIDYVGFYLDGPPDEPPDYAYLGPPPSMAVPTRRPDGSASPVFNQGRSGAETPRRDGRATRRGAEGTTSAPSVPRSPR